MDKYDRRPAVFQNNALIDCKNRTMNEKQTKLYYLGLRKMVSDLPNSSQEKRPEFTGSLMVYIPKSELVARFGAKWVQNDLYKEVDVMMSKAKIKKATQNHKTESCEKSSLYSDIIYINIYSVLQLRLTNVLCEKCETGTPQ